MGDRIHPVEGIAWGTGFILSPIQSLGVDWTDG